MDLTEEQVQEIAVIVNTVVENSVKCAVNNAINKELGQYKVPKEQHYQDHLWLKDFRDIIDSIKTTALTSHSGPMSWEF